MPLKYAAEPMEAWSKHSVVKEHFFGHDSDKGGSEIIMKFFDIPHLHSYSKEGVELIKVLYEAAELDAKVCDHESVNMLINEHWKHSKGAFHLYQTLPYIFIQVVLTIWSSSIGPFGPESKLAKRGTDGAAYLLLIYATYILYIELATLRRYGWNMRLYVT